MNNRRKTLPPIDPGTDRKVRPFLEAIKELQETGEGVRGDPLDRKLTKRDLIDSGIAQLRNGSKGEIGPVEDDPIEDEPPGETIIPPRPTNFNAIGSFGYVVLSWDIPKDLYLNHAYTQIYRWEKDNFANAEMIGRDTGMMYTDHVREVEDHGEGYYYWITLVSTDGVEGPPNSTSGTFAEVIPDIGFLLDKLSGEINEDVLTPAFNNRLDGFQETISDLGDRYTLSVSNGGHVAGFTVYNTGEKSDFAVLADRFSIANGLGDERHPFIVTGGKTYIDTAFIREASIQEGQLGPISFGKISDRYGRSVTTVAGKLKGELIEAENLKVAEAAKFYGNVYSNNYRSGYSGWAIYQSGRFEMNEGRIRESVQVGNSSLGSIAQVAGSVDNWRRPGSTLIDGNKIYTGDAYVDTLQIKGNAVTVPSGSKIPSTSFSWSGWKRIVSTWLNLEGAGGSILVNGRWDGDVYSVATTTGGYVSVSATVELMLKVADHYPSGYISRKNVGIIGSLRESNSWGGRSDSGSHSVSVRLNGPINFSYLVEGLSYNIKVDLYVRVRTSGYKSRGKTSGGFLGVWGAKR